MLYGTKYTTLYACLSESTPLPSTVICQTHTSHNDYLLDSHTVRNDKVLADYAIPDIQ